MDLFVGVMGFVESLAAPLRSSAARAALGLKGGKSLQPYPSQPPQSQTSPTSNESTFPTTDSGTSYPHPMM